MSFSLISDIEELIGHTDTKIISDAYLSSLVRQMALHADVSSVYGILSMLCNL